LFLLSRNPRYYPTLLGRCGSSILDLNISLRSSVSGHWESLDL
jgi:hypothetical protein